MTQADINPQSNIPSHDDIVALVCAELEKVNEAKVELSENTDLTKDLNVDSLAIMDLMFALEERFDVFVPLNDLADISTIKELSALVQQIAEKG